MKSFLTGGVKLEKGHLQDGIAHGQTVRQTVRHRQTDGQVLVESICTTLDFACTASRSSS
jgi:hypothetical protein